MNSSTSFVIPKLSKMNINHTINQFSIYRRSMEIDGGTRTDPKSGLQFKLTIQPSKFRAERWYILSTIKILNFEKSPNYQGRLKFKVFANNCELLVKTPRIGPKSEIAKRQKFIRSKAIYRIEHPYKLCDWVRAGKHTLNGDQLRLSYELYFIDTKHTEPRLPLDVFKSMLKLERKFCAPPEPLRMEWSAGQRYEEDIEMVRLSMEDGEIKVHRGLLCKMSAVFKAMLEQQGMIEANTKIVVITDFSHETVKAFVDYLYGSPLSVTHAGNLILFADKYDMKSFKMKCQAVIAANLDLDNALDVLNVAERCNAASLKNYAGHVVAINMSLIRACVPEWTSRIDPDLMAQLIEKLASNARNTPPVVILN